MDPLTVALAAGALGVGGSLLGNSQAKKDDKRQKSALQEALAAIQNIETPEYNLNAPTADTRYEAPDLEKISPVQLQQFQSTGNLSPELEKLIGLQDSEMGNTFKDPRLHEQRLQALNHLMGISQDGGMSAADRARQQAIQSSNRQQERGSREAILQNMRARGLSNSGAELIAQMAASQGAADRNAAESAEIAARAEQRALEALLAGEGMAGNLSREDLGHQMQKASAQDAINQWNAANAQGVNARNTGMVYDAATKNWVNIQDIANRNTDINNQQTFFNTDLQKYNNDLATQGFQNTMAAGQTNFGNDMQSWAAGNQAKGQKFSDELAKGSAAAGQHGAMSEFHGNQAKDTRNMWANIGEGAGKVVMSQFGKKD